MISVADRIEFSTPVAKSGGVDSDLPMWISPVDAMMIVSVQVPPTSVATI